jgi:hypothetical protein
VKVLRRERADGVDARLQAFLDWWEANGPFELLVLKHGGLRSQRVVDELFAQGRTQPGPPCRCKVKPCMKHPLGLTVTNAKLASQTPHGRAGGLDAAPLIDGRVSWDEWKWFLTYGELAEKRGLEWGGRWTDPRDGPHVQVPDWERLPFPPPPALVST